MAEKQITEGRRFTVKDRETAAQQIWQEREDRKNNRTDLEKWWDEVDRQLALRPDVPYKFDERNSVIPGMEWMPEIELPLQTQTLEVLTADARRFLFPDTGPSFQVHAYVDQEYLNTVDFQSLMLNQQVDVPSENRQTLADMMVRDFMEFFHKQSRFADHWDVMNSGAFSHGTLVGRARYITKRTLIHEAKGVVPKDMTIPQIVPLSIRNVYLDDSLHMQMREGSVVGPATILEWWQKKDDLILAARNSKDENDIWYGKIIANLEEDHNGEIHILEHEGDLIIPRESSRSFFVANAIVTVACGSNPPQVIRIRFNEFDSSSYITAPYQSQDPCSPYGVGPLMKGMPIHKSASEALNRLMMFAALNTQPPIKHGPDPFFDQTGGPVVAPGENWPTMADVEAVEIGDGDALLQIYINLLNQYYQLTGTQSARLGAPAKSHTTATAAQQTIEQAQLRTVDYDRAVLQGPFEQWLYREFQMIRTLLNADTTADGWSFYAKSFGSWMFLPRKLLPQDASFTVFGSAGPFEERQRQANRQAGLQLALQIELIRRQTGLPPRLDLDAMQDNAIRTSGNTDIDEFILPTAGPGAPVAAIGGPQPQAGLAAAAPASQALQRLGVGG